MRKIKYVVTDQRGVHAGPAAAIIKLTSRFCSYIEIHKEDKFGDAKKIFSILDLGVRAGDEITFFIDGEDEDELARELNQFLQNNL